MQYKPDVARLSTIHSPTLEPDAHDVSYHLASNPSSPWKEVDKNINVAKNQKH